MGFDLAVTGEYWSPRLATSREATIGVRDGSIARVETDPGAAEDIKRKSRQQANAEHGLILPGLYDSHVHPVFAGLNSLRCDLSELDRTEDLLEAITAYSRAHPEQEWLTGGGWAFHSFGPEGPHRTQLDALCPDRPVALAVRDVHAIWVNSEALRRAGVDRDTPDPQGGYIQRDIHGEPTGVLHEAAMALVHRVQPAPNKKLLDDALQLGQKNLHAAGITSWQDALIGNFGGNPDVFDAYVRADVSGSLTGRVTGALFWEPEKGLAQVERLNERRAAALGPRFKVHTVKLMQDGIPENHTAALHEPYFSANGERSSERGSSLIEPRMLTEVVSVLQKNRFDAHFHAMGDRATTEILDSIAAARAATGFIPRHQIAHLQSMRPTDIPRMAALDVTANIQALWAAHGEQMDDFCIPLLGPDRADEQFPFKDIAAAGVRLSAGSDWPVSLVSPFEAMHVAMQRTLPGHDSTNPLTPHQRLSLAEILHAYTDGGAWVNRRENTGRISPGFAADFTVIDRNPFDGDHVDVAQARTVATYVNGEEVWGW